MQHRWSENDDIVALYLYLYGDDMLDKTIDQISVKLRMSLASLKMRISNFKSNAEGRGLDHVALQSVEVYKSYSRINKTELTIMVNKIIK